MNNVSPKPSVDTLLQAKQGIRLVHVVAMDNQRAIGVNNTLPWHIPADLQHFKQLTQGGVIAMGRKTFDSLGRLLPKRTHVVLTREPTWQHDGVAVAHDLATFIRTCADSAKAIKADCFYIIGGGELYAATLAIADQLHITHVHTNVTGDTHYPMLDPQQWSTLAQPTATDEATGVTYTFIQYDPVDASKLA